MKKYLFLSLLSFLMVYCASATIRRVNYPGAFLSGVDYADFASAHNASSNGDTIQIYREVVGGHNVTKRLVIMGFGYNFDQNPGLQFSNYNNPAYLSDVPSYYNNYLNFRAGSEFSVIEGLRTYAIGIYTSNITIRRVWSYYGFGLDASTATISNTKFISCVGDIDEVQRSFPTQNTQFYNCILGDLDIRNTQSSAYFVNCVQYAGHLLFNDAQVSFTNCILSPSSTVSITGTLFTNCFFTGSTIPNPASSNNRFNVSFATLFNRLGGTSDSPRDPGNAAFDEDYYVLKSGSPAINGGFDANGNPTDCGIFGGEAAYRYRIGGQPAVPSIYQLSAPSPAANTSPYNINISIRSNN